METLIEILAKHGSDKHSRHGYGDVYAQVFDPIREHGITLLEVGVWKGHSLRAWREYFPHAFITGVDIYTRKPMVEIEGVTQFKLDSTKPFPTLQGGKVPSWDIIIDDGSHFPADQAATFRNLFPLLRSGGVYFIEDVWPAPFSRKNAWLSKHSRHYNEPAHAELMAAIEPFTVTRHDLRDDHEPDSVLLEIRR